MDRIRIARSLLKMAKAIIVGYRQEHLADCIFDKGIRLGYSGHIDCGGFYGTLEKADLEVVRNERNNGYVIFRKGTWKGGTWHDGEWLNGTWNGDVWKNGKFKGGEWLGGTWEDGTFSNAEWMGGKFENGTFRDSIWENGTWTGRGTWGTGNVWKFGYDLLGNEHGKDDSPDKWKRTFDMAMEIKLIQFEKLLNDENWKEMEKMLSEDPVFKEVARERIYVPKEHVLKQVVKSEMKRDEHALEPSGGGRWNSGLHELGRRTVEDRVSGQEEKIRLEEEKRRLEEKRRRDIAMKALDELDDLF